MKFQLYVMYMLFIMTGKANGLPNLPAEAFVEVTEKVTSFMEELEEEIKNEEKFS